MNIGDIDVIRVTKEEIDACGGADWKELIRAKADRVNTINYGYITMQPKRDDWTPPKSDNGIELPYLPRGYAWLRNVNGRAYLYLQNY